MYCQSIAKVVGVIKQSERRFSPSRHLAIDPEPTSRCVGQTAHAFFLVMFAAACRHRKHSGDGSFAVDQQEHLSIEINFNVAVTWGFRLWASCIQDRV